MNLFTTSLPAVCTIYEPQMFTSDKVRVIVIRNKWVGNKVISWIKVCNISHFEVKVSFLKMNDGMEVHVYFKECKNTRENLRGWSGFFFTKSVIYCLSL